MSSDQLYFSYPFKHTFSYATGFIFLLGIIIYLYLLIIDKLENNSQHTIEENIWIYSFLFILILGFIISYYLITCGIIDIKKESIKINESVKIGQFGKIKLPKLKNKI